MITLKSSFLNFQYLPLATYVGYVCQIVFEEIKLESTYTITIKLNKSIIQIHTIQNVVINQCIILTLGYL